MKQKTGEDRAVLKKKLADLDSEWEKVCQLSVSRQDKLEQAYRNIAQFRLDQFEWLKSVHDKWFYHCSIGPNLAHFAPGWLKFSPCWTSQCLFMEISTQLIHLSHNMP